MPLVGEVDGEAGIGVWSVTVVVEVGVVGPEAEPPEPPDPPEEPVTLSLSTGAAPLAV